MKSYNATYSQLASFIYNVLVRISSQNESLTVATIIVS